MGERETWTTEEFGSSHGGAVGVLLADGTVPAPVVFGMISGTGGRSVSEWSVYDGGLAHGPRAAALRAVCSCGWSGPEHRLDWDVIGEQKLIEAAHGTADTCMEDWDTHTAEVDRSAIPLPETVTSLLTQLHEEIEKLAKISPLAAVRAARRMEVTAAQVGYWPAHDARRDATAEQAAAALGLNEDAARKLMARFGGWSPYR
ncbi:hypothetical protein DY245_43195 [Streptomyces inhibens]|uniref:Uncharacterized protein n=1 Tax=Streptomyces inhibens TaxID=2293571 RepID=A0A371PPL0_STRIH|nr:hypothetical protein [Streptomyces inhibens]REK84462.1 hypothetical protein DY245_43195 [Streptomyces inhibens]